MRAFCYYTYEYNLQIFRIVLDNNKHNCSYGFSPQGNSEPAGGMRHPKHLSAQDLQLFTSTSIDKRKIRKRNDDEGRTSSAPLISACVILSRITGFARTWAMAFALGATFLASSYQVANNLPNMLYELVMGGMLSTAFLPVYVSVKRKLGNRAGNLYASNLLSMVVILLGIVSVLCMLFPQAIIYTQSFYSDQAQMGAATLLFSFFAIQTVFYGASSIISGILNANRDYLWSSIAPVFNNLIVIATFILYAIVAPRSQELALYIIAIGNPLGVFVQMAMQIPALRNNAVRLRFRIDVHDPAIRETLKLGVPALIAVVFSFVTISVTNAASYAFADNGPSIIAYSRLWFTLPYSFLAIPITTELFTELSHMEAEEDENGVIKTITSGISQIFFLLIPFALYLIVFSYELVTIYHIGAFSMEGVRQISTYLAVFALALPFYGVNTFLQKVFSAIRKLGVFALITALMSLLQVGLIMGSVFLFKKGFSLTIESIALSALVFYMLSDVIAIIYLKLCKGRIGAAHIFKAMFLSLILGLLGAAFGYLAMLALETFVMPVNGSIWLALAYVVACGLLSLFITFGIAAKLKIADADLILSMARKIKRLITRK